MIKKLLLAAALALGSPAASAFELDSIPTEIDLAADGWVIDCGLGSCLGNGHGSPSAGDEGKLRFFCEVSHLAYEDPILKPGVAYGAHLHWFIGHPLAGRDSTYALLRTTSGTGGTCQGGPANRTSYWMPAMVNGSTGRVVKPDYVEFYYTMARARLATANDAQGVNPFTSTRCVSQGGNGFFPSPFNTIGVACPQLALEKLPRGLAFIAGFDLATQQNEVTGRAFEWSCVGVSGAKAFLWNTTDNALGLETCSAGSQIFVQMSFPFCWDGVTLTSIDGRHIKPRIFDGVSQSVCWAGFEHQLVTIRILVAYSHDGPSDYSSWFLSSDRHNGATYQAGETFHADWYGGWDDPTLEQFSRELNGIPDGDTKVRDSATGVLGDRGDGHGTQLKITGIVNLAQETVKATREVELPAFLTQRGRRSRSRMR